ncbi:MAG: type II secretion system protein GspJ, partial [Alteromonadaceae bacterium]
MDKPLKSRSSLIVIRHSTRNQQGLTLVEVIIAISIMALIAVISYEALDVTSASREVIERKVKEIERLDRVWMLIEGDMRHVVGASRKPSGRGDPIPAMTMDAGDTYWLTLLRGGYANPLNLPRSELIRVGYRLEDETLWRDSWTDVGNPDIELAKKQKLIKGVTEVMVRAMPRLG